MNGVSPKMSIRKVYAVCILIILQNATISLGQSSTCRFADLFTVDDLVENRDNAVHRFKMEMCKWEGKFGFGVGYNNVTGITYDGYKIDYETGEVREDLIQYWTAASKEALHVNILSLYLLDDTYAIQFFDNTSQDNVVEILERKIASYNDFHRRYPGFGGFLPWFAANGSAMNLLNGWESRVPSLDNSQLIWSIKILVEALRRKNLLSLADRYQQRLDLMISTMIPVFYDANNGGIRCVSIIRDLLNESEMTNPNNYVTDGNCFLDDPYEVTVLDLGQLQPNKETAKNFVEMNILPLPRWAGELMAYFMDFYAPWTQFNLTIEERNRIWINKRAKLVRVEYNTTTPSNSIDPKRVTVQQGYWFSSHEQWKYFYLPYLDVDLQRRLFINGEKVRVYHSAAYGIPGLYASVASSAPVGTYNVDYYSACGIQLAASQIVQHHHVVTPYGSYPVIMANESIGLAWYLHMLKGSAMQNVYGSTEATHVNGKTISPVITWDSKITTVVAMLSSKLIDVSRDILQQDGNYDRFYDITFTEWSRVFGSSALLGEDLPWYLPSVSLPHSELPDFTQCRRSDGTNIHRSYFATMWILLGFVVALAW